MQHLAICSGSRTERRERQMPCEPKRPEDYNAKKQLEDRIDTFDKKTINVVWIIFISMITSILTALLSTR